MHWTSFNHSFFNKYKLYRISIGWLSNLHYSNCIISAYYFPLYPIFSYLISANYLNRYSIIILYFVSFSYCLQTLLLSLSNNWTYVQIINHQINESKANQTKSKIEMKRCSNYEISRKRFLSNLEFKKIWSETKSQKNNFSENKKIRSLTVCQISDCHLDGQWSADQLRILCSNIIEIDPDLVLLTGDYYYTKHGCIQKGLLTYALQPLLKISNRCYACFGNHDMLKGSKILSEIEMEFKEMNIKILRNEGIFHELYDGKKLMIVGFDYVKKLKVKNIYYEQKMRGIVDKYLDLDDVGFRVVLNHHPIYFSNFVGNEKVVVFCGHIHGGSVGFYQMGIYWSIYYWITGEPDYGVWKKGKNWMYVHRGNTLYSKSILRWGVPAEQMTCIQILY